MRTAHGCQRNVLLAIRTVLGVRCRWCWLVSHRVDPPNHEKDHECDNQEAYHCIDESPVVNRGPAACAAARVS